MNKLNSYNYDFARDASAMARMQDQREITAQIERETKQKLAAELRPAAAALLEIEGPLHELAHELVGKVVERVVTDVFSRLSMRYQQTRDERSFSDRIDVRVQFDPPRFHAPQAIDGFPVKRYEWDDKANLSAEFKKNAVIHTKEKQPWDA